MKNALAGFTFAVILPLLLLVFFETAIRIHPKLLGQGYANFVLSKYNAKKNGIYVHDPVLKMYLMKENFHTTMYANGYVWNHRTDSKGFRNPVSKDRTDIVLLGDSFIYGHGLDWEYTLSHFLEGKGYDAYNLARQGDSSHSEMYMLGQFGLPLKPRYVFYFYFSNDISDLFTYGIRKEEMEEFIQKPLETVALGASTERRISKESLLDKSYIYQYLKYRAALRQHQKILKTADYDLGWKYTKKAIAYMDYISGLHGAKFVIVPIVKDTYNDYLILKNFASEQNIEFLDMSDLNDKKYYLKNDEHFNEKGHERMAELVSKYIEKNQPPE